MGDIDITLANLDTFADQVKAGVPQAMEIMMQGNFLDTPYKPYIMSFSPDTASLVHKYTGIMSNMIAMGTFKGYVHAMRLKINMDDYMDHGYFNPRLRDDQITYIYSVAEAAVECDECGIIAQFCNLDTIRL